jgi:hypothetical protein
MPLSLRPSEFCLGAILMAALMLSTGTRADTVAEDSIKAGYILNFARYTEWPAAALSGKDLSVCGIAAGVLSGKLELLRGRQVQGRSVQVRVPARPGEWHDCQVLFIAADDQPRMETVLRNLGQAPVLTVSDAPDFTQAGGIIGLKLRAGRLRFNINEGAARRAGLNLSSQLLKLADEVQP